MTNFRTMMRLVICLALVFGFVTAVPAQQNKIGRLLGLSISGNAMSDITVIKYSSGLPEGEEISADDIQKAIRQLWALGLFSDIRVVTDRELPEGVFLTIHVQEYPRLEKITISGNRKIKTDEIEKTIGLFRGQVINAGQIAKAKTQLLKMYSEKGYTLAEIDIHAKDADQEGRAILEADIHEGRKVQIKRIQFFGNQTFEEKKLRKQMKKTKEDRWYRGADFDSEKFAEDKENVVAFYQNNGYRDAEVVKDTMYYDPEKKDLFIDLWVQEGRRYYYGNIGWEGNTLFQESALVMLLEFKPGDAFNQEKFQKSVQEKVGGAYYDLGYIYAQINPVETLRGKDTLDLQFQITEGKPVRIREIRILGNTRTKERVMRREIRIRPGDVFSKELLLRSHRDLMVLNYFTNVIPDVLPVSEEELDLQFKVEEKSTQTANLSAGWSELDRLIGNIGLGMNNLFGNGQVLSLDWNFGRFYRAFNLSFSEPWFLSTPTLVGANIYDTKRDPYYIGYSQRSRGISLRFGRRFHWPDNYFRGDWVYRIDETELGNFSDYYVELNPNNIVNEDWPLTSSGITQILSRNSLNAAEFPTAGSDVSLSTEVAGGPLGGNVGYHKHHFSAQFFQALVPNKLIFLTRTQLGYMDVLSAGDHIPYLEYFFMGGSGLSRSIPLRGYDDPLAGGQYYYEGGRTMFQTTVELRFPIINNPMMFGLLFAEAGNTWSTLKNTDPFDLRRSVGAGLRIFMPMVGMIGFDYAYGFDQIDYNGNRYGGWKPHFIFGRGF